MSYRARIFADVAASSLGCLPRVTITAFAAFALTVATDVSAQNGGFGNLTSAPQPQSRPAASAPARTSAPVRTTAPASRPAAASNLNSANAGKFLGGLGGLGKIPGVSGMVNRTPGVGTVSGVTGGNQTWNSTFQTLATSQMPTQASGATNLLFQNTQWNNMIKDQTQGIDPWVLTGVNLAMNWETLMLDIMRLPPYLAAQWANWGNWGNLLNVALSNPTSYTVGNPQHRSQVASQLQRFSGGADAAQNYSTVSLPRSVAGSGAFLNLTNVMGPSTEAPVPGVAPIAPIGLSADSASISPIFAATSLGMDASGGNPAARIDLSLDDEIQKSTMPIFLPKRVIERSFASDMVSRDAHMNLFETARGVAVLTLSYLDKTVAAGLATVQQQADMDYLSQLTKQISWMQTKIANPARSRFYDDVDEKLQLCMADGDESFDVRKQCKDAIVNGHPLCPKELYDEKALFSFCLCCAEQSLAVNYSTVDPRPHTFEGFSVVDRALLGKMLPIQASARGTGSASVSDIGLSLLEISRYFRILYGDVVMYNSEIEASNGVAKKSVIKIRTLPPLFDVQQFLTAIRNLDEFRGTPALVATKERGLKYPANVPWIDYARRIFTDGGTTCVTDVYPDFQIPYCPLSGLMEYGICPSLRELVRLHRTENMKTWVPANKAKYDALVNETAIGSVMSGAMIQQIAQIPDAGERERILDEKCNSLAFQAFSKLHESNVRLIEDLLTANRSVSARDKEEVRALLYRVSDQFASLFSSGRDYSTIFDAATTMDAQRKQQQTLQATMEASAAGSINAAASASVPLGGMRLGK